MRKTSLVDAKARLSELVDAAEHHGARIVILRHGKPAAAIVPVEVAQPRRRRMSEKEAARSLEEFIDEFSDAEPGVSAVRDLVDGRR
jgi:prevent-host-death family protein